MSSRQTRDLIRRHHLLRKQLTDARVQKDQTRVRKVQAELDEAGGLDRYQQASVQGQSLDRGGDTSRILVQWLKEARVHTDQSNKKLRILEVGALQVDNAYASSNLFEIERIDLQSRHPDIKTQDFRHRPVPDREHLQSNGFDIVSLSLVLNFVDNSMDRGLMLRKVGQLLRACQTGKSRYHKYFPCLFFVLPAPCIYNSRYINEELLRTMMDSLGFHLLKMKRSPKLVYQLWKFDETATKAEQTFRKREVRTGSSRNNFAITLG